LENSLLILEQGVLEGRRVFGNIIKYIKMAASSNFGNMFSVVGASAFLPFLPMLPIQVLTNNLLYDFSQTTNGSTYSKKKQSEEVQKQKVEVDKAAMAERTEKREQAALFILQTVEPAFGKLATKLKQRGKRSLSKGATFREC
jgi:magnesium-transporting ATPase (P-type)